MLFHNGRPAAKFNDSEYTLEMFSRFITKYTGMKSFVSVIILTLRVSSSDSKATGCKLNGQGLIPGWYSTFFFRKHIQYGSGEPSTLLSSKYQRLCFQEQRQPEHLANNLPPSSYKVEDFLPHRQCGRYSLYHLPFLTLCHNHY